MGFGLNTWDSDSSEHTGWMEKLQNCGQHDTFHSHRGCWIRQREEKAHDQILYQSFLAKEHKTVKNKKELSNLIPLEGINSWWGWSRNCSCAHCTWSRIKQGAQPAEHTVHGQCGNSPTSNMQPARSGFILFYFSQGHAAVKGKELKAWKIQEVKGVVSTFLKFIINRQ